MRPHKKSLKRENIMALEENYCLLSTSYMFQSSYYTQSHAPKLILRLAFKKSLKLHKINKLRLNWIKEEHSCIILTPSLACFKA